MLKECEKIPREPWKTRQISDYVCKHCKNFEKTQAIKYLKYFEKSRKNDGETSDLPLPNKFLKKIV